MTHTHCAFDPTLQGRVTRLAELRNKAFVLYTKARESGDLELANKFGNSVLAYESSIEIMFQGIVDDPELATWRVCHPS